MNGTITKVVFPHVDELGSVPVLPAAAPRGWDYEPVSEESEGVIAPDAILPASIDAESSHAYIWEHAAAAAAVVRSIWNEGGEDEGALAGMSSAQVVGAFFIAAGEEVGARVLGSLDRGEVVAVGRAITELRAVAHQAAVAALEMVRVRIESGAYLERGGVAYAQTLLGAMGTPGWAERVIDRDDVVQKVDDMAGFTSGFYLLEKIGPVQLAPFISSEHPQTIALILSQLDAAQAMGILAQLPECLYADVAYRIACMDRVSAKVLKRVEEYLEASFCEMLTSARRVGGPKVVADILNRIEAGVERDILGRIDARDPEAGESVRNLSFAFDEMRRLTDREIQTWMREVDQKDLVVALKGASDELKDKVLGNMSERVQTFIVKEMEHVGPLRLSEVEEVQLRILQQLWQLEEQGQVTIVRGDAEDNFV